MIKLFSRDIKNDPMQTEKNAKAYEKSLVRLIKKILPDLISLVENKGKLKQLAASTDKIEFDLETFNKNLDLIFEIGLRRKSDKIIKKYVTSNVKNGMYRADDFIHAEGIDDDIRMVTDPTVVDVLIERNKIALDGLSNDMRKEITREISDAMLKGESIEEMQRRIRDIVDDIGINRARTIARTETAYAYTIAAERRYEQYGIEKVEWLTAYDERTCERCAPLNGKQYQINEHPDIPLHPNCRCALLPVVEKEGE